jgi:hypothetical protein
MLRMRCNLQRMPVDLWNGPKSCTFLTCRELAQLDFANEWGWQMDAIGLLKSWIGALTDIGLMLLALAIVASLLVGGTLPFFGGVVGNIVSMVKDLGSNGLVGLIAVGIIMWLFSKRSLG